MIYGLSTRIVGTCWAGSSWAFFSLVKIRISFVIVGRKNHQTKLQRKEKSSGNTPKKIYKKTKFTEFLISICMSTRREHQHRMMDGRRRTHGESAVNAHTDQNRTILCPDFSSFCSLCASCKTGIRHEVMLCPLRFRFLRFARPVHFGTTSITKEGKKNETAASIPAANASSRFANGVQSRRGLECHGVREFQCSS